jgi:hypothetical protein
MSSPVDDRVLPVLKLPRKVEEDPRCEKISEVLKSNLSPLWQNSPYKIAELPLDPRVELALTYAFRSKKLEVGIENVEKILEQQKRGLDALNQKQGTQPALRVSRLLLVANDGSERLFRACESLLTQHGDRLLMIRFDVPSARMGKKIFGPDRGIKVLLVNERDAVESVLLALVDQTPIAKILT